MSGALLRMHKEIWIHKGIIVSGNAIHRKWNRRGEKFSITQESSHDKRRIEKHDPNSKQNDSLGKLGEEYAKHYLSCVYGIPLSEVDYEPREIHNKGWVPDLKILLPGEGSLHVKTCQESTVRYCDGEYSWLFSYNVNDPKSDTDTLFNRMDSDEIIVLMYVPDASVDYAIFMATSPWKLISRRVEESLPKKECSKDWKRALYFNHLTELC